ARGLGSVVDRRVVRTLTDWLRAASDLWREQPAQFSINLSATSLADRQFLKFTRACAENTGLPAGMIAFEIDQQLCRGARRNIQVLAEELHAIGTGLVIDNFSLHDDSVELLMLPGLRLLKLDRRLTQDAAKSRSAQAVIAGIAQMARVAGVHSVAKQVDKTDEFALLASLGVDFVQSFAGSPPQRLDALQADYIRREIVDPAVEDTVVQPRHVPAFLQANE
ncbi:MAG: EAL domain-containing protein, partial [Steroidobacteraceae bacterium]|nr:EAL domain-containing protein [Steroidobacteraceae bacterium]